MGPSTKSHKDSASIKDFKTKISTQAADHCPCMLWNKYVGRIESIVSQLCLFSVLSFFARPFANHISSLRTIQLYFLSKPTDCILCNYFESFNFTYSRGDILTDCRDFREFYVNFLFGFNQSYFVIIFTTIKFSARREKKCFFGNFKRVYFFRI